MHFRCLGQKLGRAELDFAPCQSSQRPRPCQYCGSGTEDNLIASFLVIGNIEENFLPEVNRA